MKSHWHFEVNVNVCWQVKEEKKCANLCKLEAYAVKRWAEKEGGCVYWFQPIDR
jgi:hypothetical protein